MSKKTHHFDTAIAQQVGVEAAVIYNTITYWLKQNKANISNKTNTYDNCVWTYSTIEGFCKLLPYITYRQVKVAVKKLTSSGLVKSRDFDGNTGYTIPVLFNIKPTNSEEIYISLGFTTEKEKNAFIKSWSYKLRDDERRSKRLINAVSPSEEVVNNILIYSKIVNVLLNFKEAEDFIASDEDLALIEDIKNSKLRKTDVVKTMIENSVLIQVGESPASFSNLFVGIDVTEETIKA